MSGVAAAIAGGAALSAGGGMLSAASGNRAARQQRDFNDVRTGQNYDRIYGLLTGNDQAIRRRYDAGSGTTPGAGDKWFQKNADLSGITLGNTAFGKGGFIGNSKNTIKMARNQGAQTLKNYSNAAAGTLDTARRSEATARGFGRGEEALIDQEMQRALSGANAMSLAAGNARGLGNTSIIGDQFSQNAINSAREAAKAKVGVRRDTLDRVLQAQGRQAGIQGEQASTMANLSNLNTDRATQLRDQFAKTLLALMQGMGGSSTFNPPGYSVAGQGVGAAGNTLSGIGGLLLAQNLMGGGGGAAAGGAGSQAIAANGIGNSVFGFVP